MMGIFNYCMYNHKVTEQTTEQGNENAAEEEVQIDERLQVLQDVMFLINEPSFFFRHQLLNCQHDIL